jgi:uncharacterized protein
MNERAKYITGPTILLQSGKYFDLLNPEKSEFTIEDIAHGLSNTCRFAGQCRKFYSVAEHCVLASYFVEPGYELDALLHDASEAFVGDVTRPLKELLPDYKNIEGEVSRAIIRRYEVWRTESQPVKTIDLILLATEQQQLMLNNDSWECIVDTPPLQIGIECWDPGYAKMRFLERYYHLVGASSLRGSTDER